MISFGQNSKEMVKSEVMPKLAQKEEADELADFENSFSVFESITKEKRKQLIT